MPVRNAVPECVKGGTGYIEEFGKRGSFNQKGASFIGYLQRGNEEVIFHEALHGIFGSIAGYANFWVDYQVFRSWKLPHDNIYFEKVSIPFENFVFHR